MSSFMSTLVNFIITWVTLSAFYDVINQRQRQKTVYDQDKTNRKKGLYWQSPKTYIKYREHYLKSIRSETEQKATHSYTGTHNIIIVIWI